MRGTSDHYEYMGLCFGCKGLRAVVANAAKEEGVALNRFVILAIADRLREVHGLAEEELAEVMPAAGHRTKNGFYRSRHFVGKTE